MDLLGAKRLFFLLPLFLLAGCGIVTREVFTINPDFSGKCVIEAKMFVDTAQLDAALALKDSLYGILPTTPDFHKMQFSHKDAMAFALRMINTKGVEIWNGIHYGMSKKRDMIYFSGIAYFRDIRSVHFSMLDSVLQINKGAGNQVTFRLEPDTIPESMQKITDQEANEKVSELTKNAFYIRPVLADQLNPTEATIIYNLPGAITHSSGMDQQGDRIVELTLTGNQILKYADSVVKNPQLAVKQYKITNGTNNSVIEPQFNKIVWGLDSPIQVTFDDGGDYQFDYNKEVQQAMGYFDYFMEQTRLQQYDSSMTIKEERVEAKRPKEYGELVVNKIDSAAKRPYFSDMMAIQSHDTVTFSGELSKSIKLPPEAKIHILRVSTGAEDDITDSIVARNKIMAKLTAESGTSNGNGPKRKVSFIVLVHFPPGCKEIFVLGRLTYMEGKRNKEIPFKIKQIAVNYVKKQ